MFLALERALADHGGVVAAAFSSYAGFDHLHDEPFDAVVLNGAQDSRHRALAVLGAPAQRQPLSSADHGA